MQQYCIRSKVDTTKSINFKRRIKDYNNKNKKSKSKKEQKVKVMK